MRVVGTKISERRRDKRLTVRPITIEFDGERFETLDWGLGGFLIEPYKGPHMPGDTLFVHVMVDDGRHTHSRMAEITVIRLDREYGEFGASFINMGDDVFAMLEGWMSGRLSRDALNRK